MGRVVMNIWVLKNDSNKNEGKSLACFTNEFKVCVIQIPIENSAAVLLASLQSVMRGENV